MEEIGFIGRPHFRVIGRWFPAAPSRVCLSLAVFASLIVTSCRDQGIQTNRADRSTPSEEVHGIVSEGVTLDLVEYFPVAEKHTELLNLEFGAEASDRYLTWGWVPRGVPNRGQEFRLTRYRSSVVEVPRVSPEDLRIALRIAPPRAGNMVPEQKVRVFWNGTLLKEIHLKEGRQRIDFGVPAGVQVRGLNRMELQPAYWIRPGVVGAPGGNEEMALKAIGMDIVPTRTELFAGTLQADARRGVIIQPLGSVLTYHFALPRHAQLRAEGRVLGLPRSFPGDVRPKVVVSAVDRSGVERVLLTEDVNGEGDGSEFVLDEDLSSFADQMTRISFAFSLKGADSESIGALSNVRIEWDHPRIEGTRETPLGEGLEQYRGDYNVLVVLFDTLRPDHTEPYGSPTVKTPELARLASQGVTMLNATANSTWTRTSVASMLTSTYPTVHKTLQRENGLPADLHYLPQILKSRGYKTMSIIRNGVLAPDFGFSRGFDQVHLTYNAEIRREMGRLKDPEERAEYVWDEFMAPFLGQGGEQPFFIYLHEIDPHAAYTPPPPYDTMYDFGYRGSLSTIKEVRNLINRGALNMRPADVRFFKSLYDGEITFMDAYLSRLLNRFESSGYIKDTLVLFVSDHGEEFLEHGLHGHAKTLYEEVLKVPFIISLKGVLPEGKVVKTPAELIDLPPTVLDLINAPIPPTMQGRSLLPFLVGRDSYADTRSQYAKLDYGKKHWEAIRLGSWKLLINHSPIGGDPFELYNVEDDPGETVDRWPAEPIIGATLIQLARHEELRALKFQLLIPDEIDESELDPELLKNLRALGYID